MPQFEAPVGSKDEERSASVLLGSWPTAWTDSNLFEKHYEVTPGTGNWAYHTGADLNLKIGEDEHAPVYAMGDGTITFAGIYPNPKLWGGLIVIYHGVVDNKVLYSRYGHVQAIDPALRKGVKVLKGQPIAQIGGRELGFDPHLHFDIATTSVMDGDHTAAGFWPKENLNLLRQHFVNPLTWLFNHRHMNGESHRVSKVNIPANTAEWLVVDPDGVPVRKDPRISATPLQKFKKGSTIILMKGGGTQDGYLWGQISGGEFNGCWVAVQKEDKSVDFLILQS